MMIGLVPARLSKADVVTHPSLRSIWEVPVYQRRRALRAANSLSGPHKVHFLQKLNEEYPSLLAEQLQNLPLEKYRSGIGPTLQRVPSRMLTADDGRLALMPSDIEKVDDSIWEAELVKGEMREDFEVVILCKIMGLPELLEAPRPGRDLFGSLVLEGDPGIITTDVMRATIAFKWQMYGHRSWIRDLLRYLVFCASCISGCNLL
eukprot:280239-Prymnesium_polylepis.2